MKTQETHLHQIRQNNLSRVLYTVWLEKKLSRADLSRKLDLSRSAVSSLVDQLLDYGLLTESHIGKSSGGRPPVVLTIAEDNYQIIGVDMGASHIQVIAMNLNGVVLQKNVLDFDCQNRPSETIKAIISMIRQTELDDRKILGIGVAAPCPVQNQLLSNRILPRWKDSSLKQSLEAHFSLPVIIDNDANLGALAEKWWGAGRDNESFVFIKIATGVGAGIINYGKLVKGNNSFAGEIGHIPVSDVYDCRCGMTGCLEAHIGAKALLQQQESKAFTSSHANIYAYFAHYLSLSLSSIINILNPEKIILFSPHFTKDREYFNHIQRAMKGKNLWVPFPLENIIPSSLGPQVVALGAATVLLEEVFEQPFLFLQSTKKEAL